MEPAGPARSRRTSARRDPRRRCRRLFAADGGRRGRHARPAEGATPRADRSEDRRASRAASSRPPATACWSSSPASSMRCAARPRCRRQWPSAMPTSPADTPHRVPHRHQLGDIIVEDGDIFGDGVNIAARLEGLAEPGGICVSARVQEDAARPARSRFRGYRRAAAQEHRPAGAGLPRARLPRAIAIGTVDHRPCRSPTSRRSRCCRSRI